MRRRWSLGLAVASGILFSVTAAFATDTLPIDQIRPGMTGIGRTVFEGTRIEDAVARVRQGMRAMLRLGSAWYDVAAQIKAVTERGLDSRNFILCTDDSHSGTLVYEGHMNRVVRHAIAQGLKPMTAIQMASINTAQHFGLEREIGSITPGRRADIILTTDLEKTLIGHALAERNAATVLLWDEFDMLDLAVAIRKTEDSDVMQTAARNLSLENTRYLQLDTVGEIARNVTELLA